MQEKTWTRQANMIFEDQFSNNQPKEWIRNGRLRVGMWTEIESVPAVEHKAHRIIWETNKEGWVQFENMYKLRKKVNNMQKFCNQFKIRMKFRGYMDHHQDRLHTSFPWGFFKAISAHWTSLVMKMQRFCSKDGGKTIENREFKFQTRTISTQPRYRVQKFQSWNRL